MKKRLLILALLAGASQVFALSGFMKNAIFVVKGCVKDFSDIGISESIAGREASQSPLDLKVGDIFVDVNGNAQRVIRIVKNGYNIEIETETPEIEQVFNCIRVPDQSSNFEEYGEDAVTYSPYLNRSAERIAWRQTDMLLDAMMPAGSSDYKFTINIPLSDEDIHDWTKGAGDKVDYFEKMAEEFEDYANTYNNMATQLRNKHATNNISSNMDITFGIRYKKTKNEVKYGYDYSLPHWNRHNSWWPSKWTWESGGGYAKLDYDCVYDFGFSLDVDLYVYELFSAPIPGLAYGSSSFGPYVGLYFDVEFAGGITVGMSYWKHLDSGISYRKDFNALLISKGDGKSEVGTWAPQATQGFASLNGELFLGPSLKVGFVALGMKLAQGSLSAGGYLDGELCIGYTIIDEDESNAQKCGIEDPWKTPVLANYDRGNWEPKLEEGVTAWGDFSLGLFIKAVLEAWDGKFSVKPLDYKWPVLTQDGYNNTYEDNESIEDWFDSREGQDWINGSH